MRMSIVSPLHNALYQSAHALDPTSLPKPENHQVLDPWEFPKVRDPFVGFPIIRIIVLSLWECVSGSEP